MPTWARGVLIFVGMFLFFLGIVKTYWEIKSWEVLSKLGERVPLVGTDPRVSFKLFLVVAALGATIVVITLLL